MELIGIFDVFNSHHWEAVYYSGILYLFTTSFQALSMVVVIRLILSSWNGFVTVGHDQLQLAAAIKDLALMLKKDRAYAPKTAMPDISTSLDEPPFVVISELALVLIVLLPVLLLSVIFLW